MEGALWFTDLSISDPFFILPVVLTTSNIINIEVRLLSLHSHCSPSSSDALFDERRSINHPTCDDYIISHINCCNGCDLISATSCKPYTQFMCYYTIIHVQAMSLYWAASSSYGLLQNIMLKLPVVRRAFGIPHTPNESSTPFKDIRQILQERASKFLAKQRK